MSEQYNTPFALELPLGTRLELKAPESVAAQPATLDFSHWDVNGTQITSNPLSLLIDRNFNVKAIYAGPTGNNNALLMLLIAAGIVAATT